jgi:hypothetical protein
MSAEPNAAGIARLLYIAAGAAIASWGLWGADPGWMQWTWLAIGGLLLVFGFIGYSPVHAFIPKKTREAD